MAIKVRCSSCGQNLAVPDDALGKSAKCPLCSTVMVIPSPVGIVSKPAPAADIPAYVAPPNLTPCPDCGKTVSKRASQCPHCGCPVAGMEAASVLGPASPPVGPVGGGERTFLKEGAVYVSNIRFVVSGHTFAMSGVTSVAPFVDKPRLDGPVFISVIAFFLLTVFSCAGSLMVGPTFFPESQQAGCWAIVAAGVLSFAASCGVTLILWMWMAGPLKTYYGILLVSASGQFRALRHTDQAFVNRVLKALTDAMLARG